MKYFIYFSDAKLEMLYGQLASSTERVREASLGIDLKLLKGELKMGRKVAESRYARLESVLKKLRSADLVGGIESDKPFISATLPMVWTTYGVGKDAPITFWCY